MSLPLEPCVMTFGTGEPELPDNVEVIPHLHSAEVTYVTFTPIEPMTRIYQYTACHIVHHGTPRP